MLGASPLPGGCPPARQSRGALLWGIAHPPGKTRRASPLSAQGCQGFLNHADFLPQLGGVVLHPVDDVLGRLADEFLVLPLGLGGGKLLFGALQLLGPAGGFGLLVHQVVHGQVAAAGGGDHRHAALGLGEALPNLHRGAVGQLGNGLPLGLKGGGIAGLDIRCV